MRTTSKTSQRMWPIWLSAAVVLAVWMASKWYYADWFADPFKYPAKAASLTATVLMCWAVLLSTRLRFLEDFFGGLDKVYQVHKRIGKWAFFIIIVHPLCLGADRLPDIAAFLGDMWFVVPRGDDYLIGQNFGVGAFLAFALLVVLTLWIKPAYHVWKRTHEWFGAVMALVLVHVLFVSSDVTNYPVLGALVYGALAVCLAGFFYIRFLYRFLGPRSEYQVEHMDVIEDVIELNLRPADGILDFKPSQFTYLVFENPGIARESHPYSIACGYNLAGRLKFGIKMAGDHTRSLVKLNKGDPVKVYGPYGRFSDAFLSADRDCVFIGGGIGITPFMGMWHVALHSEERLEPDQVPEELRELHPEIIKTWRSPRVALFYLCRHREEASFDDDIRREVMLSRFSDHAGLEERGHSYILHLSSELGRVTAEQIDEQVAGGVSDRYIFMCGPSAMVDSLIEQFTDLGVPRKHIIVEDFNLF
jgi:predicted ferric reductase